MYKIREVKNQQIYIINGVLQRLIMKHGCMHRLKQNWILGNEVVMHRFCNWGVYECNFRIGAYGLFSVGFSDKPTADNIRKVYTKMSKQLWGDYI